MKFSLKNKANIFLTIKVNRRTTVYCSEDDYLSFLQKSLSNSRTNKIITNKDNKRFLHEKKKRSGKVYENCNFENNENIENKGHHNESQINLTERN